MYERLYPRQQLLKRRYCILQIFFSLSPSISIPFRVYALQAVQELQETFLKFLRAFQNLYLRVNISCRFISICQEKCPAFYLLILCYPIAFVKDSVAVLYILLFKAISPLTYAMESSTNPLVIASSRAFCAFGIKPPFAKLTARSL